MKLYIPVLGEKLRLTADWMFDLYNESRNSTMMEHLGDTRTCVWNPAAIPFTLPAGSVLKTDRIFIRKGSEEFNSITFFLVGEKTQAKILHKAGTSFTPGYAGTFQYDVKQPARPVRFWVKLDDANKIEFEKA